jgi:putative ABC transport system ATP-binding protein
MSAWRLVIRDVVKAFPVDRGTTTALSGVSLEIEAGEWTVIVGPNGSGKSTLLNMLAGRFRPDSGTVTLERGGTKADWHALPPAERARYFAYIHQDPRAGSFGNLTVAENLRMSSLGTSRLWRPALNSGSEAELAVRLGQSGLANKLRSLVVELSQGQRQMIALHAALMRQPNLLLADEHTASLDQANAKKCMELTTQLWKQQGAAVVMITHDPVTARQYGTRLLALQSGRVVANMAEGEKNALALEQFLALCGMGVFEESNSPRA